MRSAEGDVHEGPNLDTGQLFPGNSNVGLPLRFCALNGKEDHPGFGCVMDGIGFHAPVNDLIDLLLELIGSLIYISAIPDDYEVISTSHY